MRFKTDENVHPDVAAACQREGRTLLTLDLDFADIRLYPPPSFPGIIVLRLATQSRPHVLQSVRRLLPVLTESNLAASLWIVDEHSIRVRGGDEPQ